MSASLRKRLNCCVAAKCSDVPNRHHADDKTVSFGIAGRRTAGAPRWRGARKRSELLLLAD